MQVRPLVVSTSFAEFDGLRGQLQGLDIEAVPLRSGSFFGRTRTLIDPSFIFTRGTVESDHRYRGTSHDTQVLLGIHFGRRGTAHFGSNVGEPGDLSALQPRQEHFGSVGGTLEYAALSIEPAELVRLGGTDRLLHSNALSHNDQIRAPAQVSAAVCGALETLTQIAFHTGATQTATRVRQLKRSLLYPFLLIAAHGESEPDGLAPEPKTTIVRRAERWLDDEPPERLHVIDLCLALGVPLRTLQRAFQETLGVGPAHYLTFYRLHKVRGVLLNSDPTDTRVTDVAIDHGFWELGRFAGLYRRTYGERPSETLRRRAVARQI
jgi:AraC family ethanolamine operon transcriptional activator